MTYTSRPIAPFKVDILSVGNPSSYTAGQKIPITGTPKNTSVTISSGQITLPAGSHWRLEYSGSFLGAAPSYATQFEIQFYSVTDDEYIGNSATGSTPGQNNARRGRVVASTLVLSSEISTSKVIEVKIVSQTNLTGLGSLNYNGKPSLRIMELPA